MNTIDNNSGEFDISEVTLTFAADYWMPTFSDNKEDVRKKRIEKILRSLNDKERT
jgi:hypothetical protein